MLRRLVEAGTRIVQLGYGAAGGKGDVDDIVDRAQEEIYDVTEQRMSEDYSRLEDMLQPTMDEMDAIAGRGGVGSRRARPGSATSTSSPTACSPAR